MADKFEYYDTYGSNTNTAALDDWFAQAFTPTQRHQCTELKIYMKRIGAASAGTGTASLRDTDSDGKPTGPDLCSGTWDDATLGWLTITLSGGGTLLLPGVTYAIVVRDVHSTGGYPAWGIDVWNGYYRGRMSVSEDEGVTWTYMGYSRRFREYDDSDVLHQNWPGAVGDGSHSFRTSTWACMSFTPDTTHTLKKVSVYGLAHSANNSVHCYIRACDADDRPTGPDLCSKSRAAGELLVEGWHDFEFDVGDRITVTAGSTYAICLYYQTTASGKYFWWYYTNHRGEYKIPGFPLREHGVSGSSSDSGVNWTKTGDASAFFEEWGDLVPGGMGFNPAYELVLG